MGILRENGGNLCILVNIWYFLCEVVCSQGYLPPALSIVWLLIADSCFQMAKAVSSLLLLLFTLLVTVGVASAGDKTVQGRGYSPACCNLHVFLTRPKRSSRMCWRGKEALKTLWDVQMKIGSIRDHSGWSLHPEFLRSFFRWSYEHPGRKLPCMSYKLYVWRILQQLYQQLRLWRRLSQMQWRQLLQLRQRQRQQHIFQLLCLDSGFLTFCWCADLK